MTGPGNPERASVPEADIPSRIGRYEIVHVLGSGAMAMVFLGRLRGPTGFSRLFAIKRPHSHLARDPGLLAMLLDEARVTARIRHVNVAQTLEVLEEPGSIAVVMEYVEGVSLMALFNHLARKSAPMPIEIAVTIVWGVLSGLHAAHEATTDSGEPLHIVHRDVSATNVLVGVDGVTRLLDFGVAKTRDRIQPSTEHGGIKGTYAYMAPEQVRTEDVDRRADVYAASVLLWQCLAGRRLWQTTDPRAILSATLFDEPPSLHDLRSEVSPELDALVRRGLAKSPDDRFASALEMANALEREAKLVSPATLAAWLKREAPELVAAAAPPPISAEVTTAPSDGKRDREVPPAVDERSAPFVPAPQAKTPWPVIALGIAAAFGLGAYWMKARAPIAPNPTPIVTTAEPAPTASSSTFPIVEAPSAAPTSSASAAPIATAPPVPSSTERHARDRTTTNPSTTKPGHAPAPVPVPAPVQASEIVDAGARDAEVIPPHRRPGVIPDTRR